MPVFFKVDVRTINRFDKPLFKHIDPNSWVLLCALASYMNSDGMCYPSYKTLAAILGVSEQTIAKRLKKLCECTYCSKPVVTRKRERKKDGTWDRNVYHINLEIVSIFTNTTSEISEVDESLV